MLEMLNIILSSVCLKNAGYNILSHFYQLRFPKIIYIYLLRKLLSCSILY